MLRRLRFAAVAGVAPVKGRSSLPRLLVALGRRLLACSLLGGAALAAAAANCPPELQAPSEAQREQAQAQARDRGFLWRLTKEGHVSHLYGTLHVGKLAWVFPGPAVRGAFDGSEVVALELDLLDPAILAGVQKGLGARPDAAPLPADLARRLQAQVKLACMPEEARGMLMGTYSPEMVLVTLTALTARRDGLETAYAADLMFSRLAHQAGKTVRSLEDPATQVALLSAESPEDLREGMELGLKGLENQSTQRGIRRVARVWAESQHDELARYAEWCECMDTPRQREAMKKMLDDRNLAMAERIDALHAGEGRRVFVAVGSLHMVGPLGLPALMARRGYQVERIEFASGPRP